MVNDSRSVVANWENGRNNVPHDKVLLIARSLGIAPDWFFDGLDTAPPSASRLLSITGAPMVEIPIAGKVAAGSSVFGDASATVLVPTSLGHVPGVTAWQVEGDSMYPHLLPGDIALFKPHSTMRVGIPFLIQQVEPRELRCKLLRFGSGPGEIVLHSLNPIYPDEAMPSGAELLGFLIGWYRSHGTRETMDFDSSGLRLGE